MADINLSWIDILIMLTYGLGVIWWGLKKAGKNSSEGYFLAGRNMTWPFIGISLFAANVSSSSILGWAGDAYSTGIAVYNYGWMAIVVLIFFAIFILPYYLNTGIFTMPEFLERRFDARSRYYFSAITLIAYIFMDTAVTLYAGGLVLRMVFPQIELWVIIWILAIAVASYTIPGGLSSVIHTEVVQAVLLIFGSIIITFLTLDAAGGWSEVVKTVPKDMMSLIRPLDDPSLPWLGLLLGVPLLGFYFWCTNQSIVQRTLSAKNLSQGRNGVLFGALLNIPILFIMVLPGTMARAIYPDLKNPDMIFPTLMFDLLPVGLIGLIMAGLLAAMSSTVSAVLNSASTLFTMDFVKKFKPELTDKKLVMIGKASSLVILVLAAFWAPQIANFDSIIKYFQQILSYMAPPVVAVFILGLFWKRASATGAFSGLVSGLVIAIILIVSKSGSWLHFLYMAPIIFSLTIIVIVAVSLMTKAPDFSTIENYTWTKKFYDTESKALIGVPWYKNFRVLSIGILIITTLLVIWWR